MFIQEPWPKVMRENLITTQSLLLMAKFLKQPLRFYRIALLGAITVGSLTQSIPGYSATDLRSTATTSESNAETMFQDRLRRLEEELRCLVCQNQSLADSDADLASDLRHEVEALARRGKNDQEIIDFLKERYGDFVSYRPPFKSTTALLWIGPLLFFGIAVGGIVSYVKRRRISATDEVLVSAEEEARAHALLGLDDIERTSI